MLNCGGGGLKAWLRGSVVLQEVREIWRATSVQSFEGQYGKMFSGDWLCLWSQVDTRSLKVRNS